MGIALMFTLTIGLAGLDSPMGQLPSFPFAIGVTTYGELNGNRFFTASGETHLMPGTASKRIQTAFAGDGFPDFVVADADTAFYWQWRGHAKIRAEQLDRFREVAKRTAPRLVVRMSERSVPVFGQVVEFIDALCAMGSIEDPTLCPEIDPVDVVAAIQGILPQPQWHSVTLQREGPVTRWQWSYLPYIDLSRLLAMRDEETSRGLCSRSPMPVPPASACPLVGRFIRADREDYLVLIETKLPVDAASRHVEFELERRGWKVDPSSRQAAVGDADVPQDSRNGASGRGSAYAPPIGGNGLRVWRSGSQSLNVSVQKTENGSRLFYVRH